MMQGLCDLRPEAAVERGAAWLKGVAPQVVLQATFCAPMVYQCDISDMHVILGAPAVAELCGSQPQGAERAALLWQVQLAAQWMLDPMRFKVPSKLGGDAVAALRAGDAEQAQSATLGLAQRSPREAWQPLLGHAAWSRADPHRAILICQVMGGLRRFGARYLPEALASVARRLASADAQLSGQEMRAAWELAQEPPPPSGPWDENSALWLLAQLRTGNDVPHQAHQLLQAGQPEITLWSAAMAAAAEVMAAAPSTSGLGVHAMTLLAALWWCAHQSEAPRQRRALTLAALDWIGQLRVQNAPPGEHLLLETLRAAPSRADSLAQLFAGQPEEDWGALPAQALSLIQAGGDLPGLARRAALLHGADSHAFKYSQALAHMAVRVPAQWRPRWLALTSLAPVFQQQEPWADRARALRLLQAS